MEKLKNYVILAPIIIITIAVAFLSIAHLINEKQEKEKMAAALIARDFYRQNEAFSIGDDVIVYMPYSSVRETSLKARLSYYKYDQGISLSLKEIKNFLKDQYLENGNQKTYQEDEKIRKFVNWCFSGRIFSLTEEYTRDLNYILSTYTYQGGIDLEDYKDKADDFIVNDVPLGLIRSLQKTYENVSREGNPWADVDNASEETLDAALKICKYLNDKNKLQ